VRFQEGTVPNWICDAIAEDFDDDEGLQSADFCLLMGFHFAGKQSFPPGKFKLGDMMSILPRPCQIVVLKMSGEDVLKSIDRGCQLLPRECGSIHHCSQRLSYTIEVAGGSECNKLKDVLFDGKPFDPERMYTVAVSHMMAKGKYGFDLQIQDIVKMWCDRHCKDEKIDPKMGRIKIVQRGT